MHWKTQAREYAEKNPPLKNVTADEIMEVIDTWGEGYPFPGMPLGYAVLNAAETAADNKGERPTVACKGA